MGPFSRETKRKAYLLESRSGHAFGLQPEKARGSNTCRERHHLPPPKTPFTAPSRRAEAAPSPWPIGPLRRLSQALPEETKDIRSNPRQWSNMVGKHCGTGIHAVDMQVAAGHAHLLLHGMSQNDHTHTHTLFKHDP